MYNATAHMTIHNDTGASGEGNNVNFPATVKVGIGVAAPTIDLAIGDADTGLNWISENELAIYTGSERMRIDSRGDVSIGLAADADVRLSVYDSTLEGNVFRIRDNASYCDADPDASVIWTCGSDARLKTNIRDTKPVLDDLMKLSIRDFALKESGEEETGVIAQEIEKVMPELVKVRDDGYLGVSEINSWKLIKAIQEQQKQIDELKAELKNFRK